ncbi:MAG: hypothetical protein Q4G69_01050 [Planctomycetia bacterium]|nr:hypothetical protein [Planctomycetia bacterium]
MKSEEEKSENSGEVYSIRPEVLSVSNSSEILSEDLKNNEPEDTVYLIRQHDPATPSDAHIESAPEEVEESPEAEIYGVSAPITRPSIPRKNPEKAILPEKDSENEPLSLDTIYARKQKERKENEYELFKENRADLPAHPFRSRIFQPFFMPGFILRLFIMIGTSFVPFYLGTRMFGARLEKMYNMSGDIGQLSGFIDCILQDRIVLFLFCFLWGIFSLPFSFNIFTATSEGDDRIEEWPEFNVIGGIGQFLWVAILILIASIPGYFISLAFHLSRTWGAVGSAIFLFPIFFLSCMETDTLFTFCTKSIFRSLKKLYGSWIQFYIISIGIFFSNIAIAIGSLWIVGRSENSVICALFVAIIIAFLFTMIPVLYLRYLGRLAWIISDYNRKRSELEDGESLNDNNKAFDDSSVYEDSSVFDESGPHVNSPVNTKNEANAADNAIAKNDANTNNDLEEENCGGKDP